MASIRIDLYGRKTESDLVFEKEDKILTALSRANHGAAAHTYTTTAEIRVLARKAELQAVGLLGSQKAAVGAKFQSRSGDDLPNAYKYSRICTAVTLRRRTRGWYLEHVQAVQAYGEAGKQILTLTPEQDAIAVQQLRKHYLIEEQA